MPRRQESMKDVVNCEKLRGVVSRHRSGDIRMGKPGGSHVPPSYAEKNRHMKTTRGTETSKYPEEKKETSIPQVAASEKGAAQTTSDRGVEGRRKARRALPKRHGKAGRRG